VAAREDELEPFVLHWSHLLPKVVVRRAERVCAGVELAPTALLGCAHSYLGVSRMPILMRDGPDERRMGK